MDTKILTDLLILTAGAWNATGRTDEKLKQEFYSYMTELQKATGATFEGAMQILLNSQKAVAA